jgi:IS5 family transposase
MREVMKRQAELGELSIGSIVLDRKSRDDIPKLLVGLQYIYTHRELRDEVFGILQEVIPQRADGKNASSALGRPGMDQWKILVLGVVRLGLDADYDRLQELANQHGTLRQMLGHADWYDKQAYEVQTLKDNLRLFTPEILGRINTAVVRAGHALLKKSPDDVLSGRCDSFVVETDVHFPTDINLLLDAVRKLIEFSAQISDKLALPGWRQSKYHLRQFKKLYRKIQQLRRSTSKDESVREARQHERVEAHQDYLAAALGYLERAQERPGRGAHHAGRVAL